MYVDIIEKKINVNTHTYVRFIVNAELEKIL